MKSLAILLLFVLASCSEIIDTEPVSTITVNSFWKSEEDAIGGLYGMYNQFRVFSSKNLILLGAARSEMMGDGLQNASFRVKYYENTLTETNADLNWQQMYRIVNFANLILKYVPEIEFTSEDDKSSIIAQAYAMRAYIYFVMARTWGDVPLVMEPIEGYDAETTFKERVPVNQIFEFIKSDLTSAEELFPNDDFNANRSIWSKPALNMLKAEVYLWTGKVLGGGDADITVALSALESAESADLELLNDYSRIFDYDNKGNQEIILAVNYKDLEADNNYYYNMYIYPADISPSIDEETSAIIGTGGGYNYWAPTEQIRAQFNEDDARKDASFLEIYTTENGERSFLTSIVLKGSGYVDGGERKFLDDVIIYRYADLLLMKAEAKNALGMDPSEEINLVRQRAYGDHFSEHEFTSLSQIENDEIILQERLFELSFEAKRWWDLIRFGKAFELVPSLQGRENDQYLLRWPVPLATLSLNSKAVQTEGY